MKILVINSRIPYPLTHGSSLILYHVFKRMAVNHDIYLLSFQNDPDDRDNLIHLKDIFTEIHLVERKTMKRSLSRYLKNVFSWKSGFLLEEQQPEMYNDFREKIEEILTLHDIDVIHTVSLFMAEFTNNINKCINVLHIIDSNALALGRCLLEKEGRTWWSRVQKRCWYLRIKNYEKRMLKHYDLSITVGKQDLEVLKRLSPDVNISLIPNGVDINYYHTLPKIASAQPTIMFFGNMSFPPNVDAVMYFIRDVFPLVMVDVPDVRLLVVGNSPHDDIVKLGEEKNITVTGYVEDIRKYIAMTDLVICPMRMGGGIKNKILEAMASGRAIVSTSIGAEGINVRHGENIIISDSSTAFADSVVQLLHDEPLRERIAEKACGLVSDQYTWEQCTKAYEEAYKDLLGER